MAYIELKQVSKRFGQVTAVDRLDLQIAKGECVAMLGPSGCGKTTTLRMVAGFDDLDEGEIRVGDRLLSSKREKYYLPPEQRNFGMVFQAFAVWPHLSVFENVAFPLRVRKLPKAEIMARTEEALKHTNLLSVASGSPDDLSGGGKQRVALARALAIRPAVMLLVMRAGVVQQIGTPLEVYGAPSNRFVFEFIGLSCFLQAGLTPAGMQIDGVAYPWPAGLAAPAELITGGVGLLAARPTEIDFVGDGGVRAQVVRKAYLGETIDYLLRVGSSEIRVQKTRRASGPAVGDACGLNFLRPHWYPV